MTSSAASAYAQIVQRINVSLATAKYRSPSRTIVDRAIQSLNIAVIFTSVESTLKALKAAANLANNLGARIRLVVPQVVPYAVPLETPPVLVQFNENRFRVIASQSPVETSVEIYLCRDRLSALTSALRRGSIVVLGGRKRWWPTKNEILARQLRRAGYEVIFKETE
jgi:hypothetical protein